MEDGQSELMVTIAAIIFGILVGHIVNKQIWVAPAIFGIAGGSAMGAIIFGIGLCVFSDGTMTSLRGFYMSMLIFGFLGGFLALKVGNGAILIGTSLVGSYLFMHGWYLMAGGLPDEFELSERLVHGERVKLAGQFGAYCAVFFLLFIASAYAQSKEDPRDNRQEEIELKDEQA